LPADTVCFEAFTHIFSLPLDNSDDDIEIFIRDLEQRIDLGQKIKESQRIYQMSGIRRVTF
jgi:hypothetical protein